MKKNSNALTISPYNSFLFLSACALSIIRIPSYISVTVDNMIKILLFAMTIISLVLYIKSKTVSKVFLSVVAFWTIIAISTVLNSGDLLQLARASFSSILLCVTFELGFKVNKRKTLMAFALVLGGAVLLNTFTMFYYYSPQQAFRGMHRDGGGDSNYYFLGQDNGTIFYSIPSIIIIVLNSLERHAKISRFVYIYTLIIGLAYLRVFSGAGIIATFTLLLVEISLNIKTFKQFLYRWLNFKTILIAATIIFLAIVIFRSENFFVDFVAELLEKNSTFTGRTRLWDIVINHITNKPILGYGLQNSIVNLAMIPYGKAHNMILQILFNGGSLALIAYLLTCRQSLINKNINSSIDEKTFLLSAFLIIIIVSNFDFYIYHPLTFLPLILFDTYDATKTTMKGETT